MFAALAVRITCSTTARTPFSMIGWPGPFQEGRREQQYKWQAFTDCWSEPSRHAVLGSVELGEAQLD